MKTLFLAFLLCLLSCGKDNESGKPSNLPTVNFLTDEEMLRDDFISRGSELLRIHEEDIRRLFGSRTLGLIRNRLLKNNIQTSPRPVRNDRQQYVRSYRRDDYVTLYVGNEDPEINWIRVRSNNPSLYDRWIMHELLTMGEVADPNFVNTDKVLQRR